MPLASANFAPVSTVPWELKGRGGACQDAGAPESGCLVKKKKSQQPPVCLAPVSLPGTYGNCGFQ